MNAIVHILLVTLLLTLIILLLYVRRLDQLWRDVKMIFSNKSITISMITLVVIILVAGLWLHRIDERTPVPPLVKVEPKAPLPQTIAPPVVQNITEIYRRIGTSVVVVTAYNEKREIRGRGSGFFTNENGHVITNHHVLNGADSGEIKTADGQVYAIHKVLAEDQPNDLILVSVGIYGKEVRPLSISQAFPEVGERVVVIGSPLGLEQTVSDGIVSAIRDVSDRGKVLQITAPISPGSSGSPVVNMRGEVIGVAFSQLIKGQNLNFCIAADKVLKMIPGSGFPLVEIGKRTVAGNKQRREIYCYLDENGRVFFTDTQTSSRYRYTPITGSDGMPDKNKYEPWVFEQIGGNPQQIDPQDAVVKAQGELPELFKKVFPPEYIYSDLPKLPQEAQIHWQRAVNQHLTNAYNAAVQKRNQGALKHKMMMDAFYLYRATLSQQP